MDRMFSVEETSDQFWSPPPNTALDELSKMNRSASEWSFQRFLQEASASQNSLLPLRPSSYSSSSIADQKDVVESKSTNIDLNINNDSVTTASFSVTPPNVPIDSEEYQAFLKSKLHLACAAVASRVKL